MPPTTQIQTSFGSGEVSPKVFGRSDLARYLTALGECENFILPKQGLAVRRSGTRFVAEVKDSADLTIVMDFRASTEGNYIVEIGDLYARFYIDRGQLLDTGSSPIEVVTPWSSSELRALKFFQSNDILYVFHPDHETREVQRTSATTFAVAKFAATNGPYQPLNTSVTQLVASGTTGTITVTAQDGGGADNVEGINGGRGFLPEDVDRQIRWVESTGKATWMTVTAVNPGTAKVVSGATQANPVVITTSTNHGYATNDAVYLRNLGGMTEVNDRSYIITVVSPTTFSLNGEDGTGHTAYTSGGSSRICNLATVTIDGPDITGGELTRTTWALGSWSDTTGWPRCGVIHQNRWWAASTADEPGTAWGSNTGLFKDFSPSEADGTVNDDNGITIPIDSDMLINIYDMKSHARGLVLLSDEAEIVASTNDGSFAPMTPSNNGARIQSTHGIRPNVPGVMVNNAVLFPQFSGRKIREFAFRFEDDQFTANDLTKLAEHIGGDDIVDIAYQEEPHETLWLVRDDGQLIALTYDPEEQVFAWHRHVIGGSFLGTPSVVESCAVVRDDPDDLLWIVVKRTVDGATQRYVEFVGDRFDGSDNAEEAFFVDSGLSALDFALRITAATQANPVHITADIPNTTGITFPNGASVKVRDVIGMTELNDNTYTLINGVVTGSAAAGWVHDFDLQSTDGTGFTAYQQAGTVRRELTSVTGLSHLEAQTVKVAGDGALQTDKTVSSGSITLDTAASIIYVGLSYNSKMTTVPLTPREQGKDVRTTHMRAAKALIRLLNSQGGKVKQVGDSDVSIEYDSATALFTGIKEVTLDATHQLAPQVQLTADSIWPMNVLSIAAEVDLGT